PGSAASTPHRSSRPNTSPMTHRFVRRANLLPVGRRSTEVDDERPARAAPTPLLRRRGTGGFGQIDPFALLDRSVRVRVHTSLNLRRMWGSIRRIVLEGDLVPASVSCLGWVGELLSPDGSAEEEKRQESRYAPAK